MANECWNERLLRQRMLQSVRKKARRKKWEKLKLIHFFTVTSVFTSFTFFSFAPSTCRLMLT